jgi:Phage major capsid protein E
MDLQQLLNAGVLQPAALTDYIINTAPQEPTRLGSLSDGRPGGGNLFTSKGMLSTILSMRFNEQTQTLVPAAPRGSPPQPKALGVDRLRHFSSVHLPQRSSVLADELLIIRARAGNDFERFVGGVQGKINALQDVHRKDLDYTLEHHRWGALRGKVLDADGTTEILDIYDEFGVSQIEHPMVLGTTTTKVLIKIIELKRLVEGVLGAVGFTGIHVYMSPEFSSKFFAHGSVEKAFELYQEGRTLRDDNRKGFAFGNTGVTFEEVSGSIAGQPLVPAGEAIAFPLGVRDMFIQDFAPADTIDAIGAETPMAGLPFYTNPYPLQYGKGIETLSQSNPVTLNTRPRAVIRLTTN